MRFDFKSKENPLNLMRRCGYHLERKDQKKLIFKRRIGNLPYPCFHLYLEIENEKITIDLHLDQKRPSYPHAPAHGAEYFGKVVEKEVERIKNILGL